MKEAENAQIHTINRMNEDRSALIRQSSSAFENAYIHIVQLNTLRSSRTAKSKSAAYGFSAADTGRSVTGTAEKACPCKTGFPKAAIWRYPRTHITKSWTPPPTRRLGSGGIRLRKCSTLCLKTLQDRFPPLRTRLFSPSIIRTAARNAAP